MQQKQFCFYRDIYSNTSLPQETRKISNNLTLYLKQLEKEEQTKSKLNRRKEIKEQNKKEKKKKKERKYKRSMKLKAGLWKDKQNW